MTSTSPTVSVPAEGDLATATQAAPVRISAVVVTRNRLALLKECLQALREQSRLPDEIIVINNGSDDGTAQWLDEQNGLTVIHQGNLGGAGGFHRGIKESYLRGHDWFWCMDDDTIPHPDALERLCATPQFRDPLTGYLGSLVQWIDGSTHVMNMWINPPSDEPMRWYSKVLDDKCVPCVMSSFVAILISRTAVEKVGLPVREMFIWCDDVEYTHRISQHFRNYHVLDSRVLHKTPENKRGSIGTITPNEYLKLSYGLRNEIYFIRVQRGSTLNKALRIAFFLLSRTRLLIKHRAPFYIMRRMWSGLFFWPEIEYLKPHSSPAHALADNQAPISESISKS
jgi:rhamnopyranosyl-N-acetylglucosaminyl-diphospho-decaprenol beta-1,3/1,4-galactofuranosyltransferase